MNKINKNNFIRSTSLLLITLVFCLYTRVCKAEDAFLVVIKKAQQKQSSRWTLTDWFRTKEKIALQNQWLALHSSSTIFEFYIAGDLANYDHTLALSNSITDQVIRSKRTRGVFGAFVSIFGLEGQWEESRETYQQWNSSFNLRILGTSNQTTNLTFQYGILNHKEDGDIDQNQFFGGQFTLYFLDVLGIEGRYWKLRGKKSKKGFYVTGYQRTGEIFLDFNFVRLYANWFEEITHREDRSLGPITTKNKRKGARFGMKLFF